MKKLLYCCFSIAIVSLCLFSCKSKDAVSKDGVVIEEAQEEKQAEEVSEKEEKKDKEDEKKEDKKSDIPEWAETDVKNPSYQDGYVKLETNSRLGTFCISAVDDQDRAFPVLSRLNEFSTSSFYLKAGKKVYKLSANEKVKRHAYELTDGVGIFYKIKNVADVNLKMSVFPYAKNEVADTIKVTVDVTNTGKRVEGFSVKAILDTILGERGSYHFYNYESKPIRNEVSYRSMRDNKWFISKNDRASMELLIEGGDTTPIEFVALANYKTLEEAKWIPEMQGMGAFDTVLSYNDSGVCVVWPEKRLYPNDSCSLTFYISLALDGMTPKGYRYVYSIKPKKTVNEKKTVVTENKSVSDVDSIIEEAEARMSDEESVADFMAEIEDEEEYQSFDPVVENVETKEEELIIENEPIAQEEVKIVEETPIKEEVVEEIIEDEEIPNVEFNIKDISKDHLTQEYVQSLMDRIADLEAAGTSVNRNEILQLNAELDAILSVLK